MEDKFTKEQYDDYCQKLLAKFKLDPLYDLQQEFGKFLMRHIDDLSPDERKRYNELKKILSESLMKKD